MTPQEQLQALALRYRSLPTDAHYQAVEKAVTPAMQRICDRYCSPRLSSEDMLQELKIALWVCLNAYDACRGKFWTVCHRCLTNAAMDASKCRNTPDPETILLSDQTPALCVDGSSRIMITELLSTLSPDEQVLFTDYAVCEYTQAEIGASRGITQQAVADRLHTIRRKLQATATKRGIDASLLLSV
jgi:RNA polymerase sigma factor (sigma-70 family)